MDTPEKPSHQLKEQHCVKSKEQQQPLPLPGPCQKLLPKSAEEMMQVITDTSVMSQSILSVLKSAVSLLYNRDFSSSLDLCQSAVDKIWEELNTGYWKDVSLSWRQAYSLVSVVKALCEAELLAEPRRNIDHRVILRTCDMGLLMGAPILGNVLAGMSREFQRAFGILGQWERGENIVYHDGKQQVSSKNMTKNEETFNSSKNVIIETVEDQTVSNSNLKLSNSPSLPKKARVSENYVCQSVSKTGQELGNKDCKGLVRNAIAATKAISTNTGTITTATDARTTTTTNIISICTDANTTISSKDSSALAKKILAPTSIPLPPSIPSQKTSEIPRCSCPSVEMFQALFMSTHHPVIITDAISYWPALSSRRWTLDYLRSVAGCRTVPVELGARYTEEAWTQKLMTVEEMIDCYILSECSDRTDSKAYLAQHQLFDQVWELRDDISVPVYCCLGEDEDVDTNAWFGPAGTVSPLHQDPKHNFLCQVMGEKYVRLYSDEHSENIYPHPTRLLHNTSQIDLDSPDLEQFPRFKNIPCLEAVLSPGDMLYIPPGHWHYVKSLAVSFSVSFWWK